jgi:hypothetical protein
MVSSIEDEEEEVLGGWVLISLSSSWVEIACMVALVVCLQEQSVKGWLW